MKNKDYIEKIIWSGIMVLMTLPIIQQQLSLFKVEPLNGVIEDIKNPELTFQSYLDQEYQGSKESYLNQNFGFRNSLVRMKNQLDYTFFNQANANTVVVGKDGYLYEDAYIKAYLGMDFVGDQVVKDNVRKLRSIKDKLKQFGTDLIMITAPGKGSFFPEFIPDRYFDSPRYTKKRSESTNAQAYRESYKAAGIPHIDLNEWFKDQKESALYPLYPKLGTHWSEYGQFLAIDTIMRFVEGIREIDLPELILDTLTFTIDNNKGSEIDIGKSMNLWFDQSTYAIADPSFRYVAAPGSEQPKTLVVSDSYYWGLYQHKLSQNVFDNGEFWYYFKTIHPKNGDKDRSLSTIDLIKEVQKQDIIIIMNTEGNLNRLGYLFIERLYEAFKGPIRIDQSELEKVIKKIKASPEWLNRLRKKAKERKISIDEMVKIDATYIIKQR